MSDDWFSIIGLNIKLIAAGFSGGLIKAFSLKKAEPWAILSSVTTGGLVANYLSPLVSSSIGTPTLPTAFMVGYGGTILCRRIFDSIFEETIRKRKHD